MAKLSALLFSVSAFKSLPLNDLKYKYFKRKIKRRLEKIRNLMLNTSELPHFVDLGKFSVLRLKLPFSKVQYTIKFQTRSNLLTYMLPTYIRTALNTVLGQIFYDDDDLYDNFICANWRIRKMLHSCCGSNL